MVAFMGRGEVARGVVSGKSPARHAPIRSFKSWRSMQVEHRLATIQPVEEVTGMREKAGHGQEAGCTGAPGLR